MPNTQDIVQKLWNLCNILRDDGITYHEYVTDLTYLLFLKMTKETGTEEQIPKGYRWNDVTKKDGIELLDFYKKLLIDLGGKGSGRVQAIFANASTSFRQPRHLRTVVEAIDALDWYSAKSEGLGDLYEGLLEKNAEETKSGAGQYFTPRPLIECMVALIKPQAGELVQDPAVGTGGFLINADRYVRKLTDDYHDLPVAKQNFQKREAFYGVELVPDVQRLALMNAMLHDIEGDIVLGDTLGPTGSQLPKADVILTNPPFGTKKGGGGASLSGGHRVHAPRRSPHFDVALVTKRAPDECAHEHRPGDDYCNRRLIAEGARGAWVDTLVVARAPRDEPRKRADRQRCDAERASAVRRPHPSVRNQDDGKRLITQRGNRNDGDAVAPRRPPWSF